MLMTDTDMADEWIANAIKNNPCVVLPSGNIRTCPVRLSFPNIFERSKPIPPRTEGDYGANLIFPLGADLSVLYAEATAATKAKWANAGTPQGPKLRSPFKKQNEMTKYAGYSSDDKAIYISATSKKSQPVCVDMRMQPIVDASRVYPGVWAIATIRPFTYDQGVNKGTSFGLQSVMIVADDSKLGGGGFSASDYEGINIDASVSGAGVFSDPAEADAAAALFG